MQGLRRPLVLHSLVAITLFACAAIAQDEAARRRTTFELRTSPLLELHMLIRSQVARQPGADPVDTDADFVPAITAARGFEQTVGDPRLWGLIEPAIASADTLDGLKATLSRLPEVSRLRDGRELRLRELALGYLEALTAVEPAFRQRHWPARLQRIEAGLERLRHAFAGREQQCLDHLVASLQMNVPSAAVPVYVVSSAPAPGAFTHRAREGAICIISVEEADDSLLAEIVLHELIHALEELEPTNALSRLRASLHEAGIDPRTAEGRDIVHTVMFVQAGETVRRVLDPEHEHYGEARGYYAKVPEATAAVREAWQRRLDGQLTVAEAIERIAEAAANRGE